jgi:4-hydroxyphenylpyruvate dioxygenase-like putative hemolysin
VTSTVLDDVTAHTVTIHADTFDAVIAFYDEWTASSPDEYQRVVAAAGGVTWLASIESDGSVRNILLSAVEEGDDTTFVSLTVGAG